MGARVHNARVGEAGIDTNTGMIADEDVGVGVAGDAGQSDEHHADRADCHPSSWWRLHL